MMKQCEHCGNEFYTRPVHNYKTCSWKCGAALRRARTMYECANPACSETFERSPSQVYNDHPCCSNACAAVYRLTERDLVNMKVSKEETEVLDRLELIRMKQIIRQHPVGHFMFDGFIPEDNLLIEYNSWAHQYFERERDKDVRKRRLAESLGYRLLVLEPGDKL